MPRWTKSETGGTSSSLLRDRQSKHNDDDDLIHYISLAAR